MAAKLFSLWVDPVLTRRRLLAGSVVAILGVLFVKLSRRLFTRDEVAPRIKGERAPRVFIKTTLNVNGVFEQVELDARTTLLDALRDHLDLTGSKKGCDHGQCGTCTVLLDGRRILSCLTFVASIGDRSITTIEGLANANGTLHPMQAAFIEHDAFQCGYCTPGQILSAVACVHEKHAANDDDIREYMSGNLCRCAAYPKIVSAIKQARDQMEASDA